RLAANAPQAYELVKALNAAMISTAAIPAYFIARRLVARRSAVIVSGLSVALPSVIYSTKVMTESLAYPLFLCALLAIFRVVERPTLSRQLIACVLVGLAALTRVQMIVLLPVLIASDLWIATLEARASGRPIGTALRNSLRALWLVTWLPIAGIAGLVALQSRGASHANVLGTHSPSGNAVDAGRVLVSMLYHLADLDLYVGIVPFAAAIVVFLVRGPADDRKSVRRFAIVTSLTTAALLFATAVYLTTLPASQPGAHVARVYDRYVFYVVPLILAAFFGWIERGLPRPRRLALPLAAVATLLPLTLPFSALLHGREWGVNSSNIALVPWAILKLATHTNVTPFVLLYGVAFAFAFLRVQASRVRTLVLVLVLNLALVDMAVQIGNAAMAAKAARYGRAPTADWIDRAVGPNARVVAIWSGRARPDWREWYGIWENQMLNRKVGGVYHLGAAMPYDAPGTRVHERDGALRLRGKPLRAEYVLTDRWLTINGRRIAADTRTRMVLYRVAGPVREG
ncbi:MAG: glycosyltransferase family 39 protein, partial [Gaiellaceae bacterium]